MYIHTYPYDPSSLMLAVYVQDRKMKAEQNIGIEWMLEMRLESSMDNKTNIGVEVLHLIRQVVENPQWFHWYVLFIQLHSNVRDHIRRFRPYISDSAQSTSSKPQQLSQIWYSQAVCIFGMAIWRARLYPCRTWEAYVRWWPDICDLIFIVSYLWVSVLNAAFE